MTNMNKRSMLAMILAVFIGLVCALGMCVQRNAIENESTTVEQAMDYDAIVVMARNDGYDLDTALQMCRDAGVTSFAIYDTTLNKLTQRGELSLVTNSVPTSIILSSALPTNPMTTTSSASPRARRTSISTKSYPTSRPAWVTIKSRSCPMARTVLSVFKVSCRA